MRIPVQFAELHMVLFMGGNLGTKVTNKTVTALNWDTEMKSLIIVARGLVSVIPEASVASWQPVNPKDIGVELSSAVINHPSHFFSSNGLENAARSQAMTAKTAQVSDPTKPVNGLTGLEGAPKYKPHAPKPKQTRLETGAPMPPKPDKDETH